jgi:GntR family transcriptional regulator/MocR family aminotransferase
VPENWATSGVDLHLEPDSAAGRRAGLEHALRDAIRSGRLAPGSRLPSSRALAADLGISRGTVSAAFDQLVAE